MWYLIIIVEPSMKTKKNIRFKNSKFHFSKYVAFCNAQFLDGVHFLMHPKSGGVQFMMHPKSERVQFMMHPKSEEVQFLMHFVVQPGSGCIKNCSIVKQ